MIRTAVLGVLALATSAHGSVIAQETQSGSSAAISDQMVCVAGMMPSRTAGSGEVRLRIPASRLGKFVDLGFAQVDCDAPGKSFVSAGLTICEMRQKPNEISDSAFRQAHKSSLAEVCSRRSGR